MQPPRRAAAARGGRMSINCCPDQALLGLIAIFLIGVASRR